MCDFCASILPNREKHDPTSCALRQAMYCSVCQIYGHSTNLCPDKSSWSLRVPEYHEQLIPHAVRKHYNITSCTPLSNPTPAPIPCVDERVVPEDEKIEYGPVLEIIDKDPKSIRAAITALGFQSKTEAENKFVLEKICAMTGKKLVYLQDEFQNAKEKANKPPKQSGKKVLKIKKSAAEAPILEGTCA